MNSGIPGFTDVDASDARAYIDYLDAVARTSQPGKSAAYTIQGITSGMSVLDIGCGTGDDVRAISALVGPTGHAVGIDFSQALVDEALRRGLPPNASISAASAYSLPFAEASFDACRAERVFQHLERPDEAAHELRRVLKPDGCVLVVDQDWETIVVSGGDKNITRRIVRALADSLANGWAGRNHSAMLQRAGLREIQVVAGVTSLAFGPAYAFVLQSAVESAKASHAVTGEEADAWIAALLDANQRGEFYYGVSVFAALARK